MIASNRATQLFHLEKAYREPTAYLMDAARKSLSETMTTTAKFLALFTVVFLLPLALAMGILLQRSVEFVLLNTIVGFVIAFFSVVFFSLYQSNRTLKQSSMITKAWMELSDNLAEMTREEDLFGFLTERTARSLRLLTAVYKQAKPGEFEKVAGFKQGVAQFSGNALDSLSKQPGMQWVQAWLPIYLQEEVWGYWLIGNEQKGAKVLSSHFYLLSQMAGTIGIGLTLIQQRASLDAQMEIIVRQERMAALGRMAASISHQINNPLQIIVGSIDAYCNYEEEPSDRFLAQAYRSALHLKDIVRSVLMFTRSSSLEMTTVDVNETVRQVVGLVEDALSERGIEVITGLDDRRPLVKLPPSDLMQVLSNLMDNAGEAITGSGRILIETKISNGSALIRLEDTGVGIPADVLSHIFDPFFTTKTQGTGLGLTIAYSIIERNHGTLTAHSVPGEGTTFVVTLPIQQEEQEA
jgi:signal transduction histidine kinase